MSTSAYLELISCIETHRPETLWILGSGMGTVARRGKTLAQAPFTEIPGIPASSVQGHRGCLRLNLLEETPVLISEGRAHYYEGRSRGEVTALVRKAIGLGAREIIITNAAGGIREDLEPGSLMPLCGQMELFRSEWWREASLEPFVSTGPSPYSTPLTQRLRESLQAHGRDSEPGIYASVTGPCYETPAEIQAFKNWGADAVGMSTAMETLEASSGGALVAGLSLITNRAAGLSRSALDHNEVLENAAREVERIGDVLETMVLEG